MNLHGVLKQKIDRIKLDIIHTIFNILIICTFDSTIIQFTNKIISNGEFINFLNIKERTVNITNIINESYWISINDLTIEQLLELLNEVEQKKYNQYE